MNGVKSIKWPRRRKLQEGLRFETYKSRATIYYFLFNTQSIIRKTVAVLLKEFVEVCLQNGNRNEAHKYLPKVKDELQIKYYCMAKLAEILTCSDTQR
jgi:hypothetical protein